METLSAGFCAAALLQSLSPTETVAWYQRWPQPVLQVVDIQRFPPVPSVQAGPSRFYLAASDGETLVWLVVPPQTPLEEAIAGFELEMGCCVTLLAHALVTAANGRNVVVPLHVKYSSHTWRLLGVPTCADTLLFPLSPRSLLQRRVVADEALHGDVMAPQHPCHRIAVRDFVANPEKALGNWAVAARVAWKGRVYPLPSHATSTRTSGAGGGTTDSGCGNPRFVFRCLLVDAQGDGVMAVFFGGEALVERVGVLECFVFAQGTVKWGTGESGAPVELQFVERSVEQVLDSDVPGKVFPLYPAALVGEVAEQLRRVRTVAMSAHVGDLVSVVGTVASVQGSTQVTTKHGRVWRSVLTLTDTDDALEGTPEAASERPPPAYVEVTLWGEVAEAVEPAIGEQWVFHPCAVQLFQQRKTLSSRSSTMAVQLRPHLPHQVVLPEPGASSKVTATGSTANATDQRVTGNQDPASAAVADVEQKHIQFVLDLQEASPTLPVLAHVQEILSPWLQWTCASCRCAQDPRDGNGGDCVPSSCAVCAERDLVASLHVMVLLSDGLSVATAVLYGSVAEALLGLTPAELARRLQRRPWSSAELQATLTSTPVLIWLLPQPSNVEAVPAYLATACKRMPYNSACHTLLSALDAFMPDSEEPTSLDDGV